jgi:hypothetical protein
VTGTSGGLGGDHEQRHTPGADELDLLYGGVVSSTSMSHGREGDACAREFTSLLIYLPSRGQSGPENVHTVYPIPGRVTVVSGGRRAPRAMSLRRRNEMLGRSDMVEAESLSAAPGSIEYMLDASAELHTTASQHTRSRLCA